MMGLLPGNQSPGSPLTTHVSNGPDIKPPSLTRYKTAVHCFKYLKDIKLEMDQMSNVLDAPSLSYPRLGAAQPCTLSRAGRFHLQAVKSKRWDHKGGPLNKVLQDYGKKPEPTPQRASDAALSAILENSMNKAALRLLSDQCR